MEHLPDNIQTLSEEFQFFVYILPLIWASFVFVEWNQHNQYYRGFKIHHSEKIGYQLIFNPKYALSLLTSTFIMLILYFSIYINDSNLLYPIAIITFVSGLCLYIIRYRLVAQLEEMRNSSKNADISQEYKKLQSKWDNIDFYTKVSLCTSVISSLGIYVTYIGWRSFFINLALCFQMPIFYKIALLLIHHPEIRPLCYVIWIVLSSSIIHWILSCGISPYTASYKRLEFYRVIIKNEKMYVILAPTSADKNDIFVAVRTIICKKNNGLIYGYLIQDEVITKSTPYEGESYVFDVNVIENIFPTNNEIAFSCDHKLRETLKSKGIYAYLKCNKKWEDIDFLMRTKDENIISKHSVKVDISEFE